MKLHLNVLKVAIGTNSNPSISNDKLLLRAGELPRDYDDTVFLFKDHYKAIFGKTRGTISDSKKLLSVVKITYTDKNNKKRSIHRAYRSEKCMTSKSESNVYSNAELIVPVGAVDAYSAADGWKEFFTIKDANWSGVEETLTDAESDAAVEYYNLQGVRVMNPGKGLYIKRQGSRTTNVVL